MSFTDIIKKGVLEEFAGRIPTGDLILSLLTAFLTGLLIVYIYKKTYSGVAYSKTAVLSFVLLAMVTSLVIRTVNSNLALSLGMVGALSIVRFRTAVKDPVDTVFMFWAITAGIMSGAGLYLITFIASLLLGIFYLICNALVFKPDLKYLLVINTKVDSADDVIKLLSANKKSVLKTHSIKKDNVELTFETKGEDSPKLVQQIKQKNGVESVHLVNID